MVVGYGTRKRIVALLPCGPQSHVVYEPGGDLRDIVFAPGAQLLLDLGAPMFVFRVEAAEIELVDHRQQAMAVSAQPPIGRLPHSEPRISKLLHQAFDRWARLLANTVKQQRFELSK